MTYLTAFGTVIFFLQFKVRGFVNLSGGSGPVSTALVSTTSIYNR